MSGRCQKGLDLERDFFVLLIDFVKLKSDANKISQEIGDKDSATETDNKKDLVESEKEEAKKNGEDFNLPPAPSMDQILGDIEEIKARYREQTEGWNKHLDDSRREADERLQKMLAQHSK